MRAEGEVGARLVAVARRVPLFCTNRLVAKSQSLVVTHADIAEGGSPRRGSCSNGPAPPTRLEIESDSVRLATVVVSALGNRAGYSPNPSTGVAYPVGFGVKAAEQR